MAFTLPKPHVCEECGDGAVFHKLTYFTISLDDFFARLYKPNDKVTFSRRFQKKIEDAFGVPFMLACQRLGLAKKQEKPDEDTLLLAKCLWEEAEARGIDMWEWRLFGLAKNMLMAKLPNGKMIAFEGIPATDKELERVLWMDDKARLKKEFVKKGLPVARGGAARNEKQALNIFSSITPPVIVKPHSGSGSRHTILHITNEAELIRAFRIAHEVSPQVVIEEELVGPVYRATLVGGKFVASLRRDPPSVIGDGTHSVSELVMEENKKPARSGPYFSKIRLFDQNGNLDEYAAKELAWQKMTPESIPPKDTRIHFHQKVNWSVGGTTTDVTDETHQDNIALFELTARELHAPVVGIDFISKDISLSWKEQKRCGILECNSMPFFDNHHLPFEGTPRNVAGAIWDMVLQEGNLAN